MSSLFIVIIVNNNTPGFFVRIQWQVKFLVVVIIIITTRSITVIISYSFLASLSVSDPTGVVINIL